MTPDGRHALVPDYHRSVGGELGELAVVRTADLHLVGLIEVCPAPHDAQPSPDGSLVAVTCSVSDEIAILEVATLELVRRFGVGPDPGPAGTPRYRPLNVVWSPDGRFVHVTLAAAGLLRTYSMEGEVAAEVRVGDGPAQLASTADGRLIVVANRLDRSASVVRVTAAGRGEPKLEEVRRLALDVPFPHGVALRPDGDLAFLTYEGEPGRGSGVVAVSPADGRIAWTAEIGAYLLGVAYRESAGES